MTTPTKTAETTEAERLATLIQSLLRRVPASVNSGSYDLAVRYKKLAQKAAKLVEKKAAKLIDLQSTFNELNAYQK